MSASHFNPLAAGISVVIVVALLTIPTFLAVISQIRHPKPKSRTYQDKDGVSTEELTSKATANIPKCVLLILSVLGLATSIFLAILGGSDAHSVYTLKNDWLNFGQWILIVIQALGIANVRNPVKRYRLGLLTTLSSVTLLAVIIYHVFSPPEIFITRTGSRLNLALRIVQPCLVISTGFASMCFPRRPEVYNIGFPVDRQFTDSAIGRYSYGWVGDLLKLARKKGSLELKDVPRIDYDTRTNTLIQRWGKINPAKPLWVKIVSYYKMSLALQWFLTVFQSIGSFAPQFINFRLLRILENRQPGGRVDSKVWLWIILLFSLTNVVSWVSEWAFWVSWGSLAVKSRAQLYALIFQKAMKRKDIKGGLSAKREDPLYTTKKSAMDTKHTKDDGNSQGTQSTVNLLSVDAKRVSDFCALNNFLPASIFKLIIATIFLQNIIGWQALGSGILVVLITIPLNMYVGEKYKIAQGRLMQLRDKKLAIVTEALQGIRQIKFSAQEANWHDKITQVRNDELRELWKVYKTNTVLLFCWIFSPVALSATSLSVYSYRNGGLDAATAFTAIGVFGNLEVALSAIPDLISRLLEAWVSVKRIEKYLDSPEIAQNTKDAKSISFEEASIAWPADNNDEDDSSRYILRNISLSFPRNELSVIGGKTGTGKSLLLAAILGEVDVLAGSISVPKAPASEHRHDDLANRDNWIIPSAIAFVNQIPWIENDSIRNNILFGLPLDDYRYKKVLEVCALRKDLEILPDGEWTEIGANGINLSGGQRWRITFARALYSRAGILVLDDIFSAVDAHVGRFIFEKGLTGELGVGRTRILVTHHIGLCKSKTKYLVELGDGTVEHAGLKAELEDTGILQKIISHEDAEIYAEGEDDHTVVGSGESDVGIAEVLSKTKQGKAARKFVEEEGREKGRVKVSIYKDYVNSSGGWPFWAIAFVLFASQEFMTVAQSWWLNIWTGHDQKSAAASTLTLHASVFSLQSPFKTAQLLGTSSNSPATHGMSYYLGIYVAFSAAVALLGTLRYFYIFIGSIRGSRNLFKKLSNTVLRTPLRWVDTVPLGRILNRFTGDFAVVDAALALDTAQVVSSMLAIVGVVGAAVIVSPYIIILAIGLLSVCFYLGMLYIAGAREVKRLESTIKSPIYEQFGSALIGITTIRAFSKASNYIALMQKQVDDFSGCSWYICVTNRWISLRMAIIGNLFTAIVAVMVVVLPIPVSVAGFVLNFASMYGTTVATLIRQYTNMELNMNAAERVIEYTNLPTETLNGADPPAAWPSEGRLEFCDLVVGYAPDLPPVLKGLSFSVEGNERIGVVGRTGAGKSSLTLALFRFLEAREGSIHIDGIDISKIKLFALRSRLAIIPQDPVLFSGTVRSNLDPFSQHTDLELRDALERVHLVTVAEFVQTPPLDSLTPPLGATTLVLNEENYTASVTTSEHRNQNIFTSLSSPITSGGLNLSQGQRQLLCLARAIASRPKIMVLDEATSAVDMATDTLIQRSIREEFGGSTLLVIAHRLSTIADFDKILVLDDGKAVEFGTPKELVQIKDGAFSSMVRESGEGAKLYESILGSGPIVRNRESIRDIRNVYGV